MTPTDLLQEFRHLLQPAALQRLQEAVARPLIPAIRVNTLKIAEEEARAGWPPWYGWEVELIPFCPAGWRILSGGEGLARTPEFKLGFYYIQEAASMLPAELLSLAGAGEPLVLDMAAAPGGKTTHLISRLDDHGLVIANDSSPSRIAPLRANLQDWGATNVVVTQALGELWGRWLPEQFDRVLLDAPCSGQGLRTAERRKSRPVSARERAALQAQQVRLLVSGFQALRPGGELVYATCTLHPDEDEAVLDALLARYPDSAEVVPVEWIHAPALVGDGERDFRPGVAHALRLWPHLYDTGGFFAALVRKRASIPTHPEPYPARPWHAAGFQALTGRQEAELLDRFGQAYGLDLAEVLATHRLSLWQRQRQVYAVPDLYLERFPDLPAVSAGMLLAEWKGPDLAPSHELVSRFGSRFTAGRVTIPLVAAERWLKGEELRGWNGQPAGAGGVVLVQDELGRLLGRGKQSGNRLRNLLPRRLVY